MDGRRYKFISSLFSGAPKPTPYPAAPTATDPSVAAAADAQRVAAANAAGMQSTILTGGQGVTTQGDIQKMILLGGG